MAHGQSEQDTTCDQGHHPGEIDKPESTFQVPTEFRVLNSKVYSKSFEKIGEEVDCRCKPKVIREASKVPRF